MMTVRCTRKLRKYLKAEVAPERPDASTTRLGDWYANLMFTKRRRLILYVSERSLLPVFVPAKNPSALVSRLQTSLSPILSALGVLPELSAHEIFEMNRYEIGSTINRSVLGSLTELIFQARWILDDYPEMDLVRLALEVAETPCSPIKYETPRSATVALFR